MLKTIHVLFTVNVTFVFINFTYKIFEFKFFKNFYKIYIFCMILTEHT